MKAEHQPKILENAIDYLHTATKQVATGDSPQSLKYGIVHLATAIELLLKARLYQEHWSLIFDDPRGARLDDLRTGGFRSVGSKAAIDRLRDISGVAISDAHARRITRLHDLRNRLTHFAADIRPEQAQSVLARALDFLCQFWTGPLAEQVVEHADAYREIIGRLTRFQTFVDTRMVAATPALKGARAVEECPACFQQALPLGDGPSPRCAFCGIESHAVLVADLLNEAVKPRAQSTKVGAREVAVER